MAMDEAAILAANESPSADLVDIDSKTEGGIDSTYREFTPLYKHFDIEKSEKADKAFNEIWEYCKSQAVNKDDKDEIMLQVIRLNHELGSGSFDEAPYAKMHRYVRIYRGFADRGRLLEEMKSGK